MRKCYFPGYRFSEDLDFTAAEPLAPAGLTRWIEAASRWSADRDGPNFAAAPHRFEVIADEYGQESYQVRLYFRGPLQWEGSPPALRLDVTRDERLLLPGAPRALHHAYSDAALFASVPVNCYAPLEILAEKVRAVSGQRRFAVSRDLYDIHHLMQTGLSVEALKPLLPMKFQARGVDFAALDPARLALRRDAYARDWRQRLDYLLPDSAAVNFDQAWATTLDLITRVRA